MERLMARKSCICIHQAGKRGSSVETQGGSTEGVHE